MGRDRADGPGVLHDFFANRTVLEYVQPHMEGGGVGIWAVVR